MKYNNVYIALMVFIIMSIVCNLTGKFDKSNSSEKFINKYSLEYRYKNINNNDNDVEHAQTPDQFNQNCIIEDNKVHKIERNDHLDLLRRYSYLSSKNNNNGNN